MRNISRRLFLMTSAALPIGCVVGRHNAPPPRVPATVRAPAVGQTWQYAKHDYFTKTIVDTQVDQVGAVGRTIDINSRSEKNSSHPSPGNSSWGLNWLHRFQDPTKSRTDLPSEVQSPWGMVLVDPHWNQVQVFKTPLPLWPSELKPGWRAHINTRYKTSDDGDGYPWDQTMKAEAWESLTVPAGTFQTLRYTNLINFRSNDSTRIDAVRRETIWFAPEIGRWAARESAGSFYVDDSAVDQPYQESGYRWELLAWS